MYIFLQKYVSLHTLKVYGLITLKILPKCKRKERDNVKNAGLKVTIHYATFFAVTVCSN